MEIGMPYIENSQRTALESGLIEPSTPGHLNYIFTEIILDYINLHGLSYQVINDVVGALEGCKLEFYRRVAADYENQKIRQNGDVYTEREVWFVLAAEHKTNTITKTA